MYISDIDAIKEKLFTKTAVTDELIIEQIISNDVYSDEKQEMTSGIKYYEVENEEILSNEFFYNLGNQRIKDTTKPNNKLVSSFLQILIDQKIDYLLSKEFIINKLEIGIDTDLHELISELSLEASKTGVSWLFAYMNKFTKKIDFKIIDSREIIPIYDNEYNEELQQVIRYYAITNTNNEGKKILYNVEVWDKEKVTYYSQTIEGDFYLDNSITVNPAYHYNVITYSLGNIDNMEYQGFNAVPFIRFDNNNLQKSDLVPVKTYIDCYDKLVSGFANSIEELQDSIIKLINYGGESDKLDEFLQYLKRYKVLPLDENGDAEYMTMEIPFEAKCKLLEILEKNIYKFGQGANIDLLGAGNITNIVIKSKFADLDLKCNKFEKEIKKFIKRLCKFLISTNLVQVKNENDFNIVFNRNIIINDSEKVDMCQKSIGVISNKTIIQNHPFVTDYDEEKKNMDEEKSEMEETFNLEAEKENLWNEQNKKESKTTSKDEE
jgi:SPP1 family phage portal protein